MERSGDEKQESGDDDMFMGEYDHSVDTKGRIIVPSKLREELGEKFIVTLGLDGCLFVYPICEWEKFVENLKEKVKESASGRMIQRRFMTLANECELDKQGRFLIPQKLRDMVGIQPEQKAVFAGVINKLELWSKDKWDEINNFDDMEDVAELMADMGLSF